LRGRGTQFVPRAVDAMLEALDMGEVSVAHMHTQRPAAQRAEAV